MESGIWGWQPRGPWHGHWQWRTLHKASVIFSKASATTAESTGRTTRLTSFPSRKKINVGQSVTRKDRPRGRPLPSSTLMWRTSGCRERAAAIRGSAARQYPHQDAPNSMTADPAIDSIAARVSTAKLGHWLRPGSFVLPSCFPILVHDYQMMQMIHRMTLPFSLSLCRDHRLPLRGQKRRKFSIR